MEKLRSFYESYPRFHVAIDCVVFGFKNGVLKILIQQRNFEPFQGVWSLMGGFVREDEDIDEAARRVCKELTGLKDVYMRQVGTYGKVDRDPGARVVSIAYCVLIDIDRYNQQLNMMNNSYWENITTLPDMFFDHKDMIRDALKLLQRKVSREPVGFNLLPPLFTLTQLQTLHEAILGERMDKRNFRKRVGEMNFIEKTDLVDKTSSRRGAFLYRFNSSEYKRNPEFKL